MVSLSRMLDDGYQIVMIGLTKKQMEGLPKEIIGIQRTENQQALAQWYSEADVFVNPTYEETFGLTSVEAQACGTPVVAYNTDGCPETVMQENGIIVPKGDVNKMKEAIVNIEFADSRADPQKMDSFANDHVYQEYIRLYRSMLKKVS